MRNTGLCSRVRKAFRGRSRGFSMIEVVIAIALLGIIGVSILTALSTATLALIIADQRATAESLARTQMEYIKNAEYIDYSKELSDPERDPDFYGEVTIPDDAVGHNLETKVEPIDPNTHQPYSQKDGNPDVYEFDDGIQQITVTVTYYVVRGDNTMREREYVLVDYKRDPNMQG